MLSSTLFSRTFSCPATFPTGPTGSDRDPPRVCSHYRRDCDTLSAMPASPLKSFRGFGRKPILGCSSLSLDGEVMVNRSGDIEESENGLRSTNTFALLPMGAAQVEQWSLSIYLAFELSMPGHIETNTRHWQKPGVKRIPIIIATDSTVCSLQQFTSLRSFLCKSVNV